MRSLVLLRLDDFALPTWFFAFWLPLAGLGLGCGLAMRAQRAWGRVVYCALVFAGVVAMTQVQLDHAPGRFWSHIAGHLVLVWWLWSPSVSYALDPEPNELPAKVATPSTVHMVFGALWLVDVFDLVHMLGYVGWP